MKKIRWGVIACGGIADRRTIPGMMLAPSCELIGVMDTNLEVAEKVAEKYGARFATADYREILANEEIEAVYIASPVFCHKEQAIAAAKAKKHILIEKPIGINFAETEKIIAACKAEGVKLGVGFMMRYSSYHTAMKEIIASGKIGDVVSMRAQFTCWYPDMNAWRQVKKLSGGGALMDMGIHCIDILQYITGLKPVECIGYAQTQTFSYDVDDSATVMIKMENGAVATVEANFNIPDGAACCPLEIYGTRGSIMATGTLSQVDAGNVEILVCPEVKGYDAQQDRSTVEPLKLDFSLGNMYTRELEAFVDAIINDTEPPVNADNTLITHKIVDLVYTNGGGKL